MRNKVALFWHSLSYNYNSVIIKDCLNQRDENKNSSEKRLSLSKNKKNSIQVPECDRI